MRVWEQVDPALLNYKHLLGEHKELHQLMLGQWENHPESKRFTVHEPGDSPRLILRHELVRVEMRRRWGDKHSPWRHKTPPVNKHRLTPDDARVLELYERLYGDGLMTSPANVDGDFKLLVDFVAWPEPLRHTSPWERDGLSLERYVRQDERNASRFVIM